MIRNMWKSYMCAAGKKQIWAILAAMNTNERVVEIRPKKNHARTGFEPWPTGLNFFQVLLNYSFSSVHSCEDRLYPSSVEIAADQKLGKYTTIAHYLQ